MSLPVIPPAKSGAVIESSVINLIIQALASLDTRVTTLEGGSQDTGVPKILDFSPKTNVHVGDPLTVSGQDLWAGGINTVYVQVGSVPTPVTQYIYQSDTQLQFYIPGVFVQAGGSSATLLIVSPTKGSSNSVSFTLLPAPVTIPTGDIRIQLASPPNTTFNAGTGATSAKYQLSYTINANTTLGDTYDLIPTVDGAGWTTGILDGVGNVIPNATLFIDAAQSLSQPTIKKGSLQLTIPPGASGSANLLLEVRSKLNPKGLDKTSPKTLIPVGGTVLLSSGIGVQPTPPSGSLDSDGNLLVPVGSTGLTLIFQLTVTDAPQIYTLNARFDNDQGNWNAQVPASVPIQNPNAAKNVSVVITANSGAQNSNLYLKVTDSANSNNVTEVFYPVRAKSS